MLARSPLLLFATVALSLAACDKNNDTGAGWDTATDAPSRDGGTTGGPGGGPGGGPAGPGGETEPAAPEIIRAAAWCQQHTVGTKYWVWFVEAEAEDPQGTETLLPVGSPAVFTKEGEVIAERELVCSDEGYCFASWEETGDEPLCSIASQYLIEVQVVDSDLNYSESVEIEPTRVD